MPFISLNPGSTSSRLPPEANWKAGGARRSSGFMSGTHVSLENNLHGVVRMDAICRSLEKVHKRTDPVCLQSTFSFVTAVPYCRRNAARSNATLTALRDLRTFQVHEIGPDLWFAVFILLDRLSPKAQAHCLNTHFTSSNLMREAPEWVLEVMTRWLTRGPQGDKHALRAAAFELLSNLWRTAPNVRPGCGRLLGYLLCKDEEIWPDADIAEWKAILQLLQTTAVHQTAGQRSPMSEGELWISAGLISAARAIDLAELDKIAGSKMSSYLGEEAARIVPYADSVTTLGKPFREKEQECSLYRKYVASSGNIRSRGHDNKKDGYVEVTSSLDVKQEVVPGGTKTEQAPSTRRRLECLEACFPACLPERR